MTRFWQDARFGARTLAKSPGLTAIAVLTLAAGIGANTAMFSVVNAVLLRPLSYQDPDRIVTISSLAKDTGDHFGVSAPDYHDWHDQATAFDSMAYYEDTNCAITVHNEAEYSHCAAVTPEFFQVFRQQPAAGHFFTSDEQKAGAVIISDAYWKRVFEGNPNAVGQSLRLFSRSLSIVGVAPPGFHFPANTDLWIPANSIFQETDARSAYNYLVLARLKTGVTLGEAQAQMTTIAARLEKEYPSDKKGVGAVVVGMRDTMVSNVSLTLYLLLGAVVVVLLIACANIASLLLAKAAGRTREIAIRSVMGASRGRIIRQMLTESGLLALVSGITGLLFAILCSRTLVRLVPGNVPRMDEISIDWRVMTFTFGICAIATLFFGLAPALQATGIDLNEALQQSGTKSSSSRGARHLHSALIIAEVAFSVVLLAGAGLLLRSFQALLNVQLGFRPEKITVMETDVPASDLESERQATQLYKRFLDEATATPGVISVSGVSNLPGRVRSSGGYWIDSLPPLEKLSVSSSSGNAVFSVITPGYFSTLRIPLEKGRDFRQSDIYEAPFTAIINEALAKQAFPGIDPIGHVIYCGLDSLNPMTIVGVVGNTRNEGPAFPTVPEIFFPYEQHPSFATSLNLLTRSAIVPGALDETLRRELREISPGIPAKFSTLEAHLSESVAAPRFRALLVGSFAGLALILAMAGIYGVMGYSVEQRTREMGIRMALGAQSSNVLQLVLGQGMRLVVAGLALGLAGAFAATRILTSLLFEVKPVDPVTFMTTLVVLLCAAFVANYLPARRATRVDPMIALHHE